MLDALGNIGDFVGGIGVVVTLFYLASQVRQNTRALKAASWQSVVQGARDTSRHRADPATARAWTRGHAAVPDLSEDEAILFASAIGDEALQFQQVLSLHDAGQMEESTYEPYLRWFASVAATPGGSVWWANVRPIFVVAMVEAVDARIAAGGLHDLLGLGDRERSTTVTSD